MANLNQKIINLLFLNQNPFKSNSHLRQRTNLQCSVSHEGASFSLLLRAQHSSRLFEIKPFTTTAPKKLYHYALVLV